MRHRALTARGARAATLLAVAVAFFTVPLTGSATAAPPAVPSVVTKATNLTPAERDRVVDYWTPERMRNAIPLDRAPRITTDNRDRSASATRTGPARRVAPTPPRKAPSTQTGTVGPMAGGYYWGANNGAKWTNGKVFFTMDGLNYVCSGSATSSNNRDLVTTAGHCVKNGTGSWASYWAFVPGYENGSRPYGTWTARLLMTTGEWAYTGNLDYDIGMVAMYTNGGTHLVNYVGGQGFAWNQPRGLYTYVFGYPAAYPYNGQWLYYCLGYTFGDPYGRSTQGIDCNMTGGSSGGPWLIYFDPNGGWGYINSNNSYKYGNDPNRLYGPYYGDVAGQLYQYATNA